MFIDITPLGVVVLIFTFPQLIHSSYTHIVIKFLQMGSKGHV